MGRTEPSRLGKEGGPGNLNSLISVETAPDGEDLACEVEQR